MLILCGFGRKVAIFGAFRLMMMAFAGGEKVGKWKAWCILNSRSVPHNLKNWSNLSDWRRSSYLCDMAVLLDRAVFLSRFFVMRRFLAVFFAVLVCGGQKRGKRA